MNTLYYIIAGGVVLIGVAWVAIRTYFSEKRRSLRAMLRGDNNEP